MTELGGLLPRVRVPPPGPASRALAARLRRVESRNVTYLADDFPVFWEEARGANVRDADGNVYLDLTGAFGVAVSGHANPRVAAAVSGQMARLPHGMGDVHPPGLKVALLEGLAAILPWEESRAVLASTGSEAVEIALKTALLATGRPGVVAFRGGYHGLTLGALAVTAREDFRNPFRSRLYPGVHFAPFPVAGGSGGPGVDESLASVRSALEGGAPGGDPVGAVVVEPIQGRAGVRIPPAGFLSALAEAARDAGALLIMDEVFTGLGRTGAMFAFEPEEVVPDLLCLGKALGGGLPLSACAGPEAVMDAWPASRGEALHTSTFLGNPAACAAALAVLDELERGDLPGRARRVGRLLRDRLEEELAAVPGAREVRGRGLFLGIDLGAAGSGAEVAARALERGLLVLPAGERGEVVELAPPLVIREEQVEHAAPVVAEAVGRVMAASG